MFNFPVEIWITICDRVVVKEKVQIRLKDDEPEMFIQGWGIFLSASHHQNAVVLLVKHMSKVFLLCCSIPTHDQCEFESISGVCFKNYLIYIENAPAFRSTLLILYSQFCIEDVKFCWVKIKLQFQSKYHNDGFTISQIQLSQKCLNNESLKENNGKTLHDYGVQHDFNAYSVIQQCLQLTLYHVVYTT